MWKSRIFPDRSWERRASLGHGLVIWFGLLLSWITLWLVTCGGVQAPYGLVAIAIGLFLHFTTDLQQPTALMLQLERLITTGMTASSRNLGYLRELLIYLGLALHWPPLVVPLGHVILVSGPNMRRKNGSLTHHAEVAEYQRGTRCFIPFIIGRRAGSATSIQADVQTRLRGGTACLVVRLKRTPLAWVYPFSPI